MRFPTAPLALISRVAGVLFPPACPVCGTETGAPATLCPGCWRDAAFLGGSGCTKCGRPTPGATPDDSMICDECLRLGPKWRKGAAVFEYAGIGRRLVLGLKHGDRQDLLPMFGTWALRAGRALVDEADLIAPVPLHWTRRLKRRCNHAAGLARWVARAAGKPKSFAPRLLVRTRRTESQDGKGRHARIANVAGALAPGPDGRMVGRRVLLVDDVMTTGATLNAAAAVCLDAGARSVDILVLALVVREEFAYIPAASEEADDATG